MQPPSRHSLCRRRSLVAGRHLRTDHAEQQIAPCYSLRVTRWKRSGGTQCAGWPASAAASPSISLHAQG